MIALTENSQTVVANPQQVYDFACNLADEYLKNL